MAAPAKPPILRLSPADRAALERMARREGDAGLRAGIALAASEESSVAAVARKTRSTRLTVRKWIGIFRERGAAALDPSRRRPSARERPPDIPPCPVPAILSPDRGAPPAHLRIECAVRRAAVRGIVAPGGLLPDRAWFARHFKASLAAVQAAFATLSAQGFTEARPRSGTRLAARLPFEGRFLLLLELPDSAEHIPGINVNMAAAVRRAEALRPGTKWDILRRFPKVAEPLLRDIATHRWQGVLMRIAHSDNDKWLPGPDPIASVPDVPMAVDTLYKGTSVSPLVRVLDFSALEPWDEAFALCRREGWRRVAVADSTATTKGAGSMESEEAARTAAASAGIAIPDGAYLSPTASESCASVRRYFELMFRLIRPGDIDAILVRRDDLLKPVAAALRARWGDAPARQIPFAVWSTGNFLPDEGMRVQWLGPDLVSIILGFMDACSLPDSVVTLNTPRQ